MKALGPEHPFTVLRQVGLADIYAKLGRYEKAESLYKRALPFIDSLSERAERGARRNYASLLRKLGREQEALTLELDVDSDGTIASEDS